ncbi:hypothetical protein H2248_011170 [Termitomyces sp. 'cryptogamus']|nr:hypothetical protein H2248_011170 [Termitomyces sp. 'cryptogamus']
MVTRDILLVQLHGGASYKDPATNAKAVPIHETASLTPPHNPLFDTSQACGNSNTYLCMDNPTVDVFEKRVTCLEDGIAAIASASGLVAQFMALSCLANSGDNIVSSSYIS